MAIKKLDSQDVNSTTSQDLDKVFFEVNNGDLEALKTVVTKFNFKNEESVFRFALALLSVADNTEILVENEGQKTTVKPSQDLLNTLNLYKFK